MFNRSSRFDKTAFDNQKLSTPSPDYVFYGNSNLIVNFNFDLLFKDVHFTDTEGDIINGLWKIYTYLTSEFSAFSDIIIRRFGDFKSYELGFDDLALEPGEEIIIDTDLFTVLIDGVHDVTAIGADSEFFHFGPGHNELIFDAEFSQIPSHGTGRELDVKILWQNRWL